MRSTAPVVVRQAVAPLQVTPRSLAAIFTRVRPSRGLPADGSAQPDAGAGHRPVPSRHSRMGPGTGTRNRRWHR